MFLWAAHIKEARLLDTENCLIEDMNYRNQQKLSRRKCLRFSWIFDNRESFPY